MSFYWIPHVEERRAEEEWLFKFAVFFHETVFKVFVAKNGLLFRVSHIFLVIVHSKSAVFRLSNILFFAHCTC